MGLGRAHALVVEPNTEHQKWRSVGDAGHAASCGGTLARGYALRNNRISDHGAVFVAI